MTALSAPIRGPGTRRRPLRHHLLWVGAACLLAVMPGISPAPAHASAISVVTDCENSPSFGKHSLEDLREALEKLPSDVDQYSDCRSMIRRAINALASGDRDNAGRPPGNVPPTADDTAAIDKALRKGGAAVKIGGERIEPGGAGKLPSGQSVPVFGLSSAHALPGPVWLLLALTFVGNLALLVPAVAKRFRRLRDLITGVAGNRR